MVAELGRMDAVALASLVHRGELSVADSFAMALERIRRMNPALNAVVSGAGPEFLEKVPPGRADGLLAGVPLLVKDSMAVSGLLATQGSWVGEPTPATEDAEWVGALRSAGCMPMGRTNMAEFGLLDVTEPLRYGPTRNPWGFDATVGGSSGGSAAAVASGMVPIAHGTDGGGSIRYPAACCGVFGFKPSRGRTTPCAPTFDERLPSTVVHHVLTRSVRDSALVFSIAEAGRRREPQSAEKNWVREPLRRKLRVAVITDALHGGPVAPEWIKATEHAAGLLWDLGHVVLERRWPFQTRAFHDAFFDWWALGVQAGMRQLSPQTRTHFDDRAEPWTLGLARHAEGMDPSRLDAIVEECRRAESAMARLHEAFDVVVTPTAAALPPKVGEHAPDRPFGELWARVKHNVGFTPLHSATGQPAMSLPLYWSEGGLPLGVQMAGAVGADELLFGLAYQLEAAGPWSDRWPPMEEWV